MASFAVRNFGCRANQAEAFAWADALGAHGLPLERDWRRADIVVVNSCTLTGRADRDVRKFLRAAARANPASRLVVTGCYAERAPGERAGRPGVSAVLRRAGKGGWVGRVLAFDAARPADLDEARQARGGDAWGHVPPVRVPLAGDAAAESSFRARGWLKVQDGCDGGCAYCVIPAVRGPGRSLPPDEAAAAVAGLAGRGFREIVLAGIHLSSYGADLEPQASLAGLVKKLGDAAGPARLRLTSLDPRRTDDGLIDLVAADERVCPHFHLSLQHASERVLGDMGRPVEPGFYEALLECLGRAAPDAAIGADLMVGFPGETEADFEAAMALVERSALTCAHVFSYSPRPGTPAAERAQLPAAVTAARARALRRAAAAKDDRFRRRFAGRTLDGVVIGPAAGGAGTEVLTGNAIAVTVPVCAVPRRERVRVTVRRVLPGRTEGEIAT